MGLRAGKGVSGEWMMLGSRGQRSTILRPRGLICIRLVNYILWSDIFCYILGRQPERYGVP